VLKPSVLAAAVEGHPARGPWQEVNLTGGDPLAIPAARALFPELVSRREHFGRLSVSTAGIPARAALDGLKELAVPFPLVEVYVSLDGVGPVHDRVRRRPGAFAEAEAFLRGAKQYGLKTALTCVINRLNVHALDDVADYAEHARLPISYALVNRSDHYINSLPLYDQVSLSPDESAIAADFLRRRSRQRLDEDLLRVLRGGRRHLPCRLLRQGLLVTSDGTVSICGTSLQMVLGRCSGSADASASWRDAVARRGLRLADGVASVCQGCTTNCYAWRRTDEPIDV
jgi:MoaA/NifB/PqqE/SkfB family radical SAM enzyme